MKKIAMVLFVFFMLLPNGRASTGGGVTLSPAGLTPVLVGDRSVIETGPLDKNVGRVTCKVRGEAVTFLGRSGSPSIGYTFTFKAVKPGEALILEETVKRGKGGETVRARRFKVRVYSLDEVPRVRVKAVADDPRRFAGHLLLLTGTSRGWGGPRKAKKVWGAMVTRSDWILEDDSGAVYVSGIRVVPKGEAVRLVCRVAVRPNGSWALFGYKVLRGAGESTALDSGARGETGQHSFAPDAFHAACSRLTRNSWQT